MIDRSDKSNGKLSLTPVHIPQLIRCPIEDLDDQLIKLGHIRLHRQIRLILSRRIEQCHEQHIKLPIILEKGTVIPRQPIQHFLDPAVQIRRLTKNLSKFLKLYLDQCLQQTKLASKVIIQSRFRNARAVYNLLYTNCIISL